MVDDYRPTHCSGLCMLSDAQQLCGSVTSHTFPHLPLALPLCFVSVCQFCSPATLPSSCLLSPRHSSFILHLFVSICLPASCLLQLLPPPAPCVSLPPPPSWLLSPRCIPPLSLAGLTALISSDAPHSSVAVAPCLHPWSRRFHGFPQSSAACWFRVGNWLSETGKRRGTEGLGEDGVRGDERVGDEKGMTRGR